MVGGESFFWLDEGFEDVVAGDKAKLTQLLAVRFVPHSRPHSHFFDPSQNRPRG